MSKSIVLLAAGAAMVLAPQAANAQSRDAYGNQIISTTSSAPIQGTHKTVDFAREFDSKLLMTQRESYAKAFKIAEAVSGCVVEKLGADAGGLVGGALSRDEQYERLAEALGTKNSSCLRAEAAGIPMSVVNAALAEQILRKNETALEPRAMSLDQDKADKFTTMAPGIKMNFDIIGRCVAVYSPGLAYDVLKTETGSEAEKQALDKLYASTPECGLKAAPGGVATGYQRGVVATGLYHWLHQG